MRGISVILLVIALSVLCCASAVSKKKQLRYDWYLQSPPNATSDKPLPRFHHVAAAHSFNYTNQTSNHSWSYDHIVVVGGFDFIGDGVFLNDTWVFNTRNNTWRNVNGTVNGTHQWANLTNRAYFSASTYRGEVIVFGGHAPNEGFYNDVWRFRDYRWRQDNYASTNDSTILNLLYREYHAAAVVADVLYVFGGHSKQYGQTTNELLAYNLTARNWTVLNNYTNGGASKPLARQGHTLHAWKDPLYGDSLILFGGYSDNPYTGGFNDAWQYVISSQKWYNFNAVNAPPGRSGHSGAILGNVLYIQGGYSVHNIDTPPTYDVYFGDTWSLTLGGGGASKWAQVTDDSAFGISRRQGHQIVALQNTLYSVGGYVQYVGLDNSVWAFQNVNAQKKFNK